MAFFRIEPWGESRGDLQAGVIASTMANIHRDPKKRSSPYSPADFIPNWDKDAAADPESEKTPEKIYQKIRTIFLMAGAKTSDGNGSKGK